LVVGGDATSPVGAVSVGGVGSLVGAASPSVDAASVAKTESAVNAESAETRRAPTASVTFGVIRVVGLVSGLLRAVGELEAGFWRIRWFVVAWTCSDRT
jgi:hypothetical protein